MDKFVIRKATWKTKTYDSIKAESIKQNGARPSGSSRQQIKQNILRENEQKKQMNMTCSPVDLSDKLKRCILKERDNILVSFVNTTPRRSTKDFGESLSGSLTSTRLSFGGICESSQAQPNRSNAGKKYLNSPLNNVPQEKEVPGNNMVMTTINNKKVEMSAHPPLAIVAMAKPTLAIRSESVATRIQKDLQSPSAMIRSRALRAVRSPTASSYNYFDVAHEEQSIITAEERNPPKPPNLSEIFQNVVIYVEVRSGEDNRSEGVKKVIASMGANVNDRLLRTTSHVVFKDGLLSTFKKARSMNIPVVSILWIEACKNKLRLLDPALFPISNLDQYENPELYPKIPRRKFMQPGSENNKRIRKPTTPTHQLDSTPSNNGSTQRLLAGKTPTSTKSKTDIKQFFHVLDSNKNFESPATRFLNRITNNFHTPQQTKKTSVQFTGGNDNSLTETTPLTSENKSVDNDCLTPLYTNKSFNKGTTLNEAPREPKTFDEKKTETMEDKTSDKCFESQDISSNVPISSTSDSKNLDKNKLDEELQGSSSTTSAGAATPRRRSTRRSTLEASTNTSKTLLELVITPDPYKRRRRSVQCNSKADFQLLSSASKSSSINFEPIFEEPIVEGNVTNYSKQSLDMSEVPSKEQSTKRRRRTLFTPHSMDISEPSDSAKDKEESNKRGSSSDMTVYLTPVISSDSSLMSQDISINVETTTNVPQFSSTRLPDSSSSNRKKRLTLYDVSMDIINQRILSINASSSRRSLAQLPETDIATSISSAYLTPRITTKSTPKLSESEAEMASAIASIDTIEATKPAVKKRKLFVPNPEIEPMEPPPPTNKTNRRRTMAGTSTLSLSTTDQMQTKPSDISTITVNKANPIESVNEMQTKSFGTTASIKKAPLKKPLIKRDTRRSTLDFEQIKHTSQVAVPHPQSSTVIQKSPPPPKGDGDHSVTGKSQSTTKSTPKKRNAIKLSTMVYTNMHREQISVIRKAVSQLGFFKLNHIVNSETTHLVSLEPRRTLNMLRGLMGGVWILKYSWILDSVRAGAWVREEHYEMHAFSRAVEICRAERQAFGKNYRCELFHHMEPFYVSMHCKILPKVTVKELLTLGNANIVEFVWRAKYIIGDKRREMDDKIYLTEDWVLDSIQSMQIQRFNKYVMPSCIIVPKHPTYEIRQPIVERVFQLNTIKN